MKTLFVSDLDGTLMRSDKTLSDKTVQTLNRLIENGVLFTYATARSIQSAMEITGKLKLKLPVITRKRMNTFARRQRSIASWVIKSRNKPI